MDTTDRITKIQEVPCLTFDEPTHTYRLDGLEVPSVSAIMAPLSKAKYAGISERTLERAADKGTTVHNAIENWIKFGIEDIPTEYMGYFRAFRQWWDENKPEVVGSEIRICHPLMRYAGTTDLVAYIKGRLTIIDFKTTYIISDMTCGVQLEAYAQAISHMGVKPEAKAILQLKKDECFVYKDYPANDQARWRVFGALKTVYDYIEASR